MTENRPCGHVYFPLKGSALYCGFADGHTEMFGVVPSEIVAYSWRNPDLRNPDLIEVTWYVQGGHAFTCRYDSLETLDSYLRKVGLLD